MSTKTVLSGGLAAFLVLAAVSAEALPVFSRKYQTSCMTCHESFPRLNGIGEAFRVNGYQFVDDELYIKEEPVELGDEAYKRVWPNAVWPSDIPGPVPISFVVKSQLSVDPGNTGDSKTDFGFPEEVSLLGAGKLGSNLSFFLEVEFENGGDETETGIEGWLQFEDLFGPENAFNLRVGTMGMQEFGLFTARDHNRMTLNRYLYSGTRMPIPDAGGAARRGVIPFMPGDEIAAQDYRLASPQPGFELNGFGKNWRYAVGIVNGNDSIDDNNSDKDIYTQLTYKIGGRNFDGSALEGQAAQGGAQPWRDDSLTLAFFSYMGTGTVTVGEASEKDRFWRAGPGVRWKRKDLALNGGYILGENNNPYGSLDDQSVDFTSWFLEGEYVVFPWLTTTVRYEELQLDLATSGPGSMFIQPKQDQSRVVLSAKALLRANLSLTAEALFHTKDERATESPEGGSKSDNDQLLLGMNLAF
jgi:hypothetical protein